MNRSDRGAMGHHQIFEDLNWSIAKTLRVFAIEAFHLAPRLKLEVRLTPSPESATPEERPILDAAQLLWRAT